jgi:branched-chain amino acid transport system substrate-binding protein
MAPQGHVRLDPETLHAWLTPRIGCSNRDGGFTILRDAVHPVAADPYLIRHSSRFTTAQIRPNLRVVS